MTYLLTFGCYGCWLPGDVRGTVDRKRGQHRGGVLAPSPALAAHSAHLMNGPAFRLNHAEAAIVLEVTHEVCAYRGWVLRASHVRSTHVHLVVTTAAEPKQVIADLKAYASRRLNQTSGVAHRWSRGGNAARLSSDPAVKAAIDYVTRGQGTPMAVWAESRDSLEIGGLLSG